jgi:ABC-three component (ABC-3C) system Middle Component 3
MEANDFSEEELSLFNPAYTGFLLFTMMREYSRENGGGMHCSLPFVLLPMIFNPAISKNLPTDKRSSLLAWISNHQGELMDFSESARTHQPIVMNAIFFLMEKNLLVLSDDGEFLLGPEKLPKNPAIFSNNNNMRNAMRTANFLGRWFSHAPPIETVYVQLGVRP